MSDSDLGYSHLSTRAAPPEGLTVAGQPASMCRSTRMPSQLVLDVGRWLGPSPWGLLLRATEWPHSMATSFLEWVIQERAREKHSVFSVTQPQKSHATVFRAGGWHMGVNPILGALLEAGRCSFIIVSLTKLRLKEAIS